MSIDCDYIRAVLARFEGEGIARGYVPAKNGVALGVSGVTIGTGVDLGQQSEAGLSGMGVPRGVVEKLRPYLGLKKDAAQAALNKRPLSLAAAEVKALDDAVIGRYVRDIAAFYDKNFPAQPFARIPREAQAVLVSLLFQRGRGYAAKVPALWRALLAGEWAFAAAWLLDPANGGGYRSRRKGEGEILQSIGANTAKAVAGDAVAGVDASASVSGTKAVAATPGAPAVAAAPEVASGGNRKKY